MNLRTDTLSDEEEAAGAQPPLSPEQLTPHFPQLEILECLGRGGMGVVYKARQKSLNRFVALKLLAPERVRDAKFAERFSREAQALAALNHPHIVTVHDFGAVDAVSSPQPDAAPGAPAAHSRIYFLLMEFVDGVNLRAAMNAGRFTPEEALAIVPPICEALQYAHEHGIVHRDIKPENLLLDKEGRVKIADFGVAKMLGMEASEGGGAESQPAGTPRYMAPEQRGDAPRVDHRADIYSLGVVLYEMLTGQLPAGKLEAPSSRIRGMQIDVRLDEIVLRALNENPDLRYRTAAEFKTDLETFASSAPAKGAPAPTSSQRAPPASAPVSPWPRFLFWLLAVIVTLPVGLLAIAVLLPVLTQRRIGAGEFAFVVGLMVLCGLIMIAAVAGLARAIPRNVRNTIYWLCAGFIGVGGLGVVSVAAYLWATHATSAPIPARQKSGRDGVASSNTQGAVPGPTAAPAPKEPAAQTAKSEGMAGIGVNLGEKDGHIIARSLYYGSAVQDGTLKGDDIIAKAGDGIDSWVSLDGMKLEDADARIHGKEGSSVSLFVVPAGKGPEAGYTLTLVRKTVTPLERSLYWVKRQKEVETHREVVLEELIRTQKLIDVVNATPGLSKPERMQRAAPLDERIKILRTEGENLRIILQVLSHEE
jgi:predicted Ser/Thr protein kinase